MTHYHHKAARSQEQLEEMKRLSKQGICIFCPEHIHQDTQRIEIETKQWMVKKNRYPYENTKLHLILIPKKHVKTISELPKTARQEFIPLVVSCERKYHLSSYAIGIRSGDMRLNGGSMEHLHVHLVVGDTDSPNHQPVRFKMSNKPD